MDIQLEPEIGKQVFRNLDDELRILNETAIAYGVWDWRPGRMRYHWGNVNMLKHVYKMSLEQLRACDPAVGSENLLQHMHSIADTVQIRKRTVSDTQTLDFGGVPTTITSHFRPLRVHLPGGQEETFIFCSMTPKPENQLSEEDRRVRLATQVMMYVQVKVSIFGGESERRTKLYENPMAKQFYDGFAGSGDRDARGWTLDDLMATCDFDHEQEKTRVAARIKATGLQDSPWEFECRKRQPSGGETVWHRVSVSPSVHPSSSECSIVVQEYDITKLKEVQTNLMAVHEAQDLFFASISHELRSPLLSIIGLTSSLQKNRACPSFMQKVLSVILTSLQRMVGLVNDILDAASCKRGAMIVKKEVVDLPAVVRDVCAMLKSLLKPDVALVSEVDVTFPKLFADSGRLNQILTNLVSNAIKFTSRGKIQVRASVSAAGEGRSVARIEVEDSGEGVAEDKLDKIWEGFQMADAATAQRHGGTGLGLALVKSLVEAQGGTVAVTSSQAPGASGSTFSFTLPLFTPDESFGLLQPTIHRNMPQSSSVPPAPSPEDSAAAAAASEWEKKARVLEAEARRLAGERDGLACKQEAARKQLQEMTREFAAMQVALTGMRSQTKAEAATEMGGGTVVGIAVHGACHAVKHTVGRVRISSPSGCPSHPVGSLVWSPGRHPQRQPLYRAASDAHLRQRVEFKQPVEEVVNVGGGGGGLWHMQQGLETLCKGDAGELSGRQRAARMSLLSQAARGESKPT